MGTGEEAPQAQPALKFLPSDSLPRLQTTVTYPCSACDGAAGRIDVWVSDATGKAEVIVSGLVGVAHMPLEVAAAPELVELLAKGAAVLYRHDPEWASFHCPECERSYCQKHWLLQIQFEDDPLPGWYDCTHGTCPAGHRRIVDD